MPETITTETTVYTLAELTALDEAAGSVNPSRRETAIENVRDRRAGQWGDSHDIESMNETIVWGLAEALKSPEWDEHGPSDFPGIDGVELQGWDLERGQCVLLDGHLTRENAPALPWAAGIDSVTLEARRDHTTVWLVMDEPTEDEHGEEVPNPAAEDQIDAMREAVKAAMHTGWKLGYDELEYQSSDEYLIEDIEANETRFLEDGSFYG